MSAAVTHRPPPREAPPELLVLQRWEEHSAWLLQHTSRWPRSMRFTLCRRVQEHALDVAEMLVVARYEPRERAGLLRRANLVLERMRLLLRFARTAGACSARGFESAVRGIDETGRMIHGWRESLRARAAADPANARRP